MPDGAFCPRHPDSASVGTCQRCGTFVCEDDVKRLVNGVFCEDCAVRPEIAYLDAIKQRHWGKRDVWAWLFGLSGVGSVVGAIATATTSTAEDRSPLLWALVLGVYAIVGIAFWLRIRAARVALVLLFAVFAGWMTISAGPMALIGLLVPGLFLISALTNVRTRLFFEIEVSAATLEREWRREYDNPLARSAVSWGLGSFFIPLFAPVAIITSILALLRVNPSAQPPIGGRGRAIAGLVLGLLGGLFWFGLYGLQFVPK